MDQIKGILKRLGFYLRDWRWRLAGKQFDRPVLPEGIGSIVFVCKGNICRSALAEAVARSLGFPTCSFGTDTHLGKPANPGMVAAAGARGYDLAGHQTAPLEGYAWRLGDLVLVFEPGHLEGLASGIGKDWRIELLGAWARPRRAYIHDPFEGTPQYFQRVVKLVEGAVINLVESVGARNA